VAKEFTLAVVAPDRAVVEQPVISVTAPGLEGYFGVLGGHVPFVAALKPGMVEYQDVAGARHHVSVSGGFAEVSGEKMTILADAAERLQDIDIARAERALEEARRALQGGDGNKTQEEAVQEMERAINRLRAAQRA
jgi:F-type H+-transporting ATPase subunit epsilon